jgi:HPt (histidine-containing phosphotransfer) domain-containing protein
LRRAPAGGGGAQHVVALQQALDGRAALRQQAQDQRAVGDRLVARRAHRAFSGAAAAGAHRLGRAMMARQKALKRPELFGLHVHCSLDPALARS